MDNTPSGRDNENIILYRLDQMERTLIEDRRENSRHIEKMMAEFVPVSRYRTVELLVYGGVAVALTSVLGGLLALVIRGVS